MALQVERDGNRAGRAVLTLTNTGTDHALPTGTPDRYLSVTFRLLENGHPLRERKYRLRRTILWRPFIIDLRDSRLLRDRPQSRDFVLTQGDFGPGRILEATVRYHLLDETRRRRIGYENREPVDWVLYRQEMRLPPNTNP